MSTTAPAEQKASGETGPTPAAGAADPRPRALLASFTPLIVDAAVPMASYYLLTKACGMSTLAALAWSSVLPAARTAWGIVKERRLNGLAALILVVNVVSLLLSSVTGDVRLMLAKDSAVSSVIGIVVLVTAFAGRPLMTTGLKPWVTKGEAEKTAAWQRLSERSARFRRAERTFSIVWGAALLGECVVRVVGAYTLPVDTMVWLGNVVLGVAVVLAIVIGGRWAVDPMEKMVEAEAAGADAAGSVGAGAAGRLGGAAAVVVERA
ncbi:VC0807 family protein [Streptomyces sp. URMC 123]|uniref:VC0807 family protein n=1 Tax=Streptomyces sp. URMC 123 TaxID=3423403 RepID=UPI003F1E3D8E